MVEIRVRDVVYDELWDIWQFIAKDNPSAATRVIEAIEATFVTLADSPNIGQIQQFRKPRTQKIRRWRVSEFGRYHVFYYPIKGGHPGRPCMP
jgi:toxin ParE1/3/4